MSTGPGQVHRWVDLIGSCGLIEDGAAQLLLSDSFGPLTAEFRRAEANGYDLATLLPKLVANRGLADAVDVGAVLISRLHHGTAQPRRFGRRRVTPPLIVGLVPPATGVTDAEQRQALDERQSEMERRATELVERATRDQEPWLHSLGSRPEAGRDARRWLTEARIVAAYRDRYGITGPRPLGPHTENEGQRADRTWALAAIRRAGGIAHTAEQQAHGRRPAMLSGIGR